MSNTEHTPGPWFVTNNPHGHNVLIVDSTGEGPDIAEAFSFARRGSDPYDIGIETAEANARLIAAAPELLEALRATLAHAEDMLCHLEDTDDLSGFPYIQRARAVIAKAEGRT